MEATMQTHKGSEPMDAVDSFARQFRLLWTSRRPIMLLVAVLGLLALIGPPFIDTDMQVARLLPIWWVLVLIGPVWAFAVFNNEGPGNRMYHWSQPVPRWIHSLARVAAGAAWLVVVYVVLLGAGLLFGAMDGNAWQYFQLPVAAWANFFTGPLIGYLGVSILAVISDHPIRWFFGLVFLLPLVMGLVLNALGLDRVMEVLAQPVTHSQWGLGQALAGAFGSSAMSVMAEAIGMAEQAMPEFRGWWVAMGLWLVLFGGLTVLVSTRHPDTLPRLRWSR